MAWGSAHEDRESDQLRQLRAYQNRTSSQREERRQWHRDQLKYAFPESHVVPLVKPRRAAAHHVDGRTHDAV